MCTWDVLYLFGDCERAVRWREVRCLGNLLSGYLGVGDSPYVVSDDSSDDEVRGRLCLVIVLCCMLDRICEELHPFYAAVDDVFVDDRSIAIFRRDSVLRGYSRRVDDKGFVFYSGDGRQRTWYSFRGQLGQRFGEARGEGSFF